MAHSPELRPTMVHLPERLTFVPGARRLLLRCPKWPHEMFIQPVRVSPTRHHSLYRLYSCSHTLLTHLGHSYNRLNFNTLYVNKIDVLLPSSDECQINWCIISQIPAEGPIMFGDVIKYIYLNSPYSICILLRYRSVIRQSTLSN